MQSDHQATLEMVWAFLKEPSPSTTTQSWMTDPKPDLQVAQAAEFSLFSDEHAKLACDHANSLIDEADALVNSMTLGGTDETAKAEATRRAVQQALTACRALEVENADLSRTVLMMFMTHFPGAAEYSSPALAVRSPIKALSSNSMAAKGFAASGQAGSTPPEDLLDWFREDPLFNEHHEHWHIVYPFAGILGKARDRQGENFLYMHQQMLARYDAERHAVGLPRVEPFDDFCEPMDSGYAPGEFIKASFPYHAERPAGLTVSDINRPMYTFPANFTYTVAKQVEEQRRLKKAIDSGYLLTSEGARIRIDANLLGHVIEASEIESVNKDYYGRYHNNGHRFIAVAHDPDGSKGLPQSVMSRPETSFRDPIFFRWHKHIDDLSYAWQEQQESHDFSDSPPVLMRSGHAAGGGLWSPDIIVCKRKDVETLRSKGLLMDEIAAGAFGGSVWRDDFSDSISRWKTKEAECELPTHREILTRMSNDFIEFEGDKFPYQFVNHEQITFFFRIRNNFPETRDVTLRLFIVPSAFAEDRRAYIELDKFRVSLKGTGENVVWRHDTQSSIVRKPAITDPGAYNRTISPNFGDWVLAPLGLYLSQDDRATPEALRNALFRYHEQIIAYRAARFGDEGEFDVLEAQLVLMRHGLEASLSKDSLDTFSAGLADYHAALSNFNFDRAYCGCGYPYSMVYPRGTVDGMAFNLWAIVTDWEHDRVGDAKGCASMSFCGAKDRYPDVRPMGYPFDRAFQGHPEETLCSLQSAAARQISVRLLKSDVHGEGT
ncbi:tyrosinase family protein [Roseibium album]|uniref:tyrosinase family protein n=1 Tax=Roseibium album TaxID=311410 RepID=UPI003297C0C4